MSFLFTRYRTLTNALLVLVAVTLGLTATLSAQQPPVPGINGRPRIIIRPGGVAPANPYDAAVFREWTSADGKLTTKAKLIDFSADGIAKLQRLNNGKVVTIASEKLSKEDQEYLGAFSQANLRTKEEMDAVKPKVTKLEDWGKWIDPESDCNHRLKDGVLQILVPSGAYDLSAEQNRMNAPRVLKAVDDKKFVFEVKVDGKFKAKDSVVRGRKGYHGAGILVMADAKNYIRLERATFNDTHYINFEVRENGRLRQFGNAGESKVDPTKPTWLRLAILDADAVAGFRQDDGEYTYLDRRIDWDPDVRFDGSVQSVGVAVVNSSSAKVEPIFNERKMTTDEALLEKIDEESF